MWGSDASTSIDAFGLVPAEAVSGDGMHQSMMDAGALCAGGLAVLVPTRKHFSTGQFFFFRGRSRAQQPFTTAFPLSYFLRRTAADWAHSKNMALECRHVPGETNDWADDLFFF